MHWRHFLVPIATHVIKDSTTHPASQLFKLLPSGRNYRSVEIHNSRLRDSFCLQAISTNTLGETTLLNRNTATTTITNSSSQ